jgi:hypothetical protein
MLIFYETINYLGFIDIALKQRIITWSNVQQEPLLEKLVVYYFHLLDYFLLYNFVCFLLLSILL